MDTVDMKEEIIETSLEHFLLNGVNLLCQYSRRMAMQLAMYKCRKHVNTDHYVSVLYLLYC